MSECPGGIETCICPGLVDPAVLHRREYLKRTWADIREQIASGTVALSAVPSAVAELIAESPQEMRGIIRASLREDAIRLSQVRRWQQLAGPEFVESYPECVNARRYVEEIGPDGLAQSDQAEAVLECVGYGIGSVGRSLEAEQVIALTGGSPRTTMAPQVIHPMLSHESTRSRLRLAGHPSNRRQLGYGRLHRGQPAPEAETTGPPQDGEGNQVPSQARGRRRPLRASRATPDNRRSRARKR